MVSSQLSVSQGSSEQSEICVWTHPSAESQESSVHVFSSSHAKGGPPMHEASKQKSSFVHASPSSHVVGGESGIHPLMRLHPSAVHGLPSEHKKLIGAPCWQLPFEHTSPRVHAMPSLHGFLLCRCTQPSVAIHASVVHGFPSMHRFLNSPLQVEPMHVSAHVHALPSSHTRPGKPT